MRRFHLKLHFFQIFNSLFFLLHGKTADSPVTPFFNDSPIGLVPEPLVPLVDEFTRNLDHESVFHCALCDLPESIRCEHHNLCDAHDGCKGKCPDIDPKLQRVQWQKKKFLSFLDYRVAKSLGPKGEMVRITAITESISPPMHDFYDYNEAFVGTYEKENLFLHTAVKNISDGPFHVAPGVEVDVKFPKSDDTGIAGVLIGDPCYQSTHSKIALVGCFFSWIHNTYWNTPKLLNAFVPQMDFWSLMGDNWYDQTGYVTKEINEQFSHKLKSVPFLSVPGNHDFWLIGKPLDYLSNYDFDQRGSGFMQYYGQDTIAARDVMPGSYEAPYNFTAQGPWKLPPVESFFFYHRMGNTGIMGFSGAHTWNETKPYFDEACNWFQEQKGIRVILLLGHWDINNMGSSIYMDTPDVYALIAKYTTCAPMKRMIKFVMGHTHCNEPHPHGYTNIGFMVAGQGMVGCGNYGVPIFDTTEGRVRFYYFPIQRGHTEDLIRCVNAESGWRQCTHLAEMWLDEPLEPSWNPREEEKEKENGKRVITLIE